MIKKTFTYTDYNDNVRTEEHYFNLSRAEVIEMELSTVGGLVEMMQRIINAQDSPAIVKVIKELIAKSYGVKSPDGKRFMKEKPDGSRYFDEFYETEAYSMLFEELTTNADAAAKFFNGIIPKAPEDKKPALTVQ